MTIGQRVRERRLAHGFSQENLAHAAGLSWGAIQRLEAGKIVDPHYSTLEGIAHTLGTTVAELVGEKAPVPLDEAPGKEPRLEGTMITFPEGAVDEVVKLHKQGKLSKADVREAIGKLTDLALENATEEIEEYMAEMAARVKEAHGDRPK
jgi:transcriptional regulator with XRE-family HTH domain